MAQEERVSPATFSQQTTSEKTAHGTTLFTSVTGFSGSERTAGHIWEVNKWRPRAEMSLSRSCGTKEKGGDLGLRAEVAYRVS